MGRMWQQVVQHWRRAEAVAAPPTTLPPSLLDSLPPPALLAISLLATVLVMYIASWLIRPAEEVAEKPAAAPTAAAAPVPKPSKFRAFEVKMRSEGCSPTAIAAFKYNYGVLVSGADLMIGEAAIKPIEKLPTLDELDPAEEPALLECTVMLKLNGGLGTGMGLDKAKSLLVVKGEETFLDLIAKQLVSMRESLGANLAFMLMNSFATSADTLGHLSKYPHLPAQADLEFVQNKAPKVLASDLSPATWPKDRSHEWCPPGHGDLYPAMVGSGTLDKLLARKIRYMFVSNSDNLGATMDLRLLTHFANSGAPFMMECAERTEADKKGGHLARDAQTGNLLLRESAQCPDADEKAFQDTGKYKYFNTNNLWVDLIALQAAYAKHDGALPLPVMKNAKTVDPRDKSSSKVLQLETAMGSAISCFEGATAVCIPRARFAPVKTSGDLLALRSDAYVLTPDYRIELAPARKGVPPTISLDDAYKFVDALDKAFPHVPSLLRCKKLTVKGHVVFAKGVIIRGEVTICNSTGKTLTLPCGAYENIVVDGKPLYDAEAFLNKYSA
mmetsp:Transcript_28570/g.66974  ORF Transcript_28570/g.66974 Transcript_28570/m.66974 type:complete len:557 (-) Transcript_28570:285-1955(-)